MGGRGAGGGKGSKSSGGGGGSISSKPEAAKNAKGITEEKLFTVRNNSLSKLSDKELQEKYNHNLKGHEAEKALDSEAFKNWSVVNHKIDRLEGWEKDSARKLNKQSNEYGAEMSKRRDRAKTRKFNSERLKAEILRRVENS